MMGAVAVLHPQDCLREPSRVRPTRSRPQPLPRRKRSPNTSPPSRASARNNDGNANQSGPVQGQIRILKRGEAIPEASSPPPAAKASDLGRLSPIPMPAKPLSKPAPFYAGSAFITSPPPSSLPLPAFFAKKVVDDADMNPHAASRCFWVSDSDGLPR